MSHNSSKNTKKKRQQKSTFKSPKSKPKAAKLKTMDFFNEISLSPLQRKNLEFVAGALSISIPEAYSICKKFNFDSNAILANDTQLLTSKTNSKWSKKSTKASKHRSSKNSPKKTESNTTNDKPKNTRIPPMKHKQKKKNISYDNKYFKSHSSHTHSHHTHHNNINIINNYCLENGQSYDTPSITADDVNYFQNEFYHGRRNKENHRYFDTHSTKKQLSMSPPTYQSFPKSDNSSNDGYINRHTRSERYPYNTHYNDKSTDETYFHTKNYYSLKEKESEVKHERRPPILRNPVNDTCPSVPVPVQPSPSPSTTVHAEQSSDDTSAAVFGILSNGGLVIVPPVSVPDIYKPFVLLPFDVLAKLANYQSIDEQVSAEQLVQWFYNQQKHMSYALTIGESMKTTDEQIIDTVVEEKEEDEQLPVIEKSKCHPVLKAHNTGSIRDLRQMRNSNTSTNSNLNPSAMLFMPDDRKNRVVKSTAIVPYYSQSPVIPLPIVPLPMPMTSPLSFIDLSVQQSSPLPPPLQTLSMTAGGQFNTNVLSIVPSLVGVGKNDSVGVNALHFPGLMMGSTGTVNAGGIQLLSNMRLGSPVLDFNSNHQQYQSNVSGMNRLNGIGSVMFQPT